MNVKKSLGSRIRGWFPKEPTVISTRLKVNHENKQPPLIIPSDYKLSATKIAGAFAIFWLIFYGFIFFTSFSPTRNPISSFQIVAWIIAGLAVGLISNAIVTKNQLTRISKDYQFTPNGKDVVLVIVPIILLSIFSGFVSLFLYSSLQVWLISIYAWGISFEITRIVLFAAFEKKENMRLMQSWWGANIILVPKAPINIVKRLEIAAEQRH